MYDIARLHAALNDLPTALLLTAVFFDLAGAVTKREALAIVGFWTLVLGAVGAGLAVLTGLLAERAVEHGDAMHAVMEQHETLAITTTVIFGLLTVWRLVRRNRLGPRERPVFLTAGVIGVGLLIATSQRGGELVFRYGGGIPTAELQRALEDRGAHDHAAGDHSHEAPDQMEPVDSAAAAGHEHPPGTPPHEH